MAAVSGASSFYRDSETCGVCRSRAPEAKKKQGSVSLIGLGRDSSHG